MSKSRTLTALGLVLIILSLATRLWVYGAESEARRIGGEQLAALGRLAEKEGPSFHRLSHLVESNAAEKLKDVNLGNKTWTAVISDPPGASIGPPGTNYGPTSSFTPTLISGVEQELVLSTRYQHGIFQREDFSKKPVHLSLKPGWYILFSLLYPGLLLLGLGWYFKDPKKKPRAPSDSGVTMVREPLPLPKTGPVRHDPDTPQELIFGDFVKGEHLGKGNMGEVYRCHSGNAADSRPYALKVLLPEWSDSEDFRKRFEREAAICQKLDHPNLVRAYQNGEKGGRLWLVMDYIAGGELKDWLDQSKRSEKEILSLFQQICSGLGYAHEQDVVHRDLKPDNILITNDGQAVIADFGLARGKHYETITKTNTTLGTPIYMPPEQVVGGTGSPTGDLYGLGCILYEMLAGHPPFEQTDVLVLLQDKLSGKMPEKLKDVPSELNDLVFKLLAYSPEDRFQSASELSDALTSLN